MSTPPLLNAQNLSKTFARGPLFEDISLTVSAGERIAIIGPNGSGKSTLLKMCAGLEEPDRGSVQRRRGLPCFYVPQLDIFNEELTVYETLRESLADNHESPQELERRISLAMGGAGFSSKDAQVKNLSGGWRKRLAIVRGLVQAPEILLLDEPTNHLDIEGVLWLEKLLLNGSSTLVFVSHDRYFIEQLATRVIEINKSFPGGAYSSKGSYADFIEARSAYLAGLRQTQTSLANKVRREVEWLRQGAKARTTKQKARIDRAGDLQEQLSKFNLEPERAGLGFSASKRKTRELIKVNKASKSFGERQLFKNISLTISPGTRLGIVGANGSGKTSFIKTLLGDLPPDSGSIQKAGNLKIAFFDQARKGLDKSLTLKEALCPQGDGVVFNDQVVHVAGWAKRFLFTLEQLSVKVEDLSGGEQARVLLAKMMLEQADIILFDEPTNDLDINTLEILEESFCEFEGALVLVTHDRYFLDRVATVVLGLAPDGGAIFGDYRQWQEHIEACQELTSKSSKSNKGERNKTASKLGYLEQRELSGMEAKILKAEELLAELQDAVNSESVAADAAALAQACQSLVDQQKQVDQLYERWQELEDKKKSFEA